MGAYGPKGKHAQWFVSGVWPLLAGTSKKVQQGRDVGKRGAMKKAWGRPARGEGTIKVCVEKKNNGREKKKKKSQGLRQVIRVFPGKGKKNNTTRTLPFTRADMGGRDTEG